MYHIIGLVLFESYLIRFKINGIMVETRSKYVSPFRNPQEISSLPDDLILLLQLGINIAPVIQLVSVILLAIGGLSSICWSLVRALLIIQEEQQRQEAADIERRESTDLRIPLDYGQYTAIRILPAIKKITSKTDLFM